MYLRRKADSYLQEWKNGKDRLPLIVKGARQVGKTETIRRFADASYKSVIYINFALEKKYINILGDGYSVESITKNISLIDNSKQFIPGETVIIFDELQECPDVATSLKSFKLDGRYDVICSGSMLGINYKKIHSNSVGYKTDYDMFSMDFEEFLWGKGYVGEQIDDILLHMLELRSFGKTEIDAYGSMFLDYCVTGGMPAVVSRYVETGLFTGVSDLQAQILLDYEEDARKYAEGLDQGKIISVLRSVPSQLAKENKKFQYSKITQSARAREYQGCVEWLRDAGVVSICYCLQYPELPLKGNYDDSRFKLYYPDTGLLVASIDEEAQDDLRANKNLGVYKGALYENFIAEAFVKQGYELFYYRRDDSTLEEDFFIRSANELIPIEVKSNDNRSKSLSTLIKNKNYSDVKHGIKLMAGNIGSSDNIITFPYFCCFLLKRYMKQQEIFR